MVRPGDVLHLAIEGALEDRADYEKLIKKYNDEPAGEKGCSPV